MPASQEMTQNSGTPRLAGAEFWEDVLQEQHVRCPSLSLSLSDFCQSVFCFSLPPSVSLSLSISLSLSAFWTVRCQHMAGRPTFHGKGFLQPTFWALQRIQLRCFGLLRWAWLCWASAGTSCSWEALIGVDPMVTLMTLAGFWSTSRGVFGAHRGAPSFVRRFCQAMFDLLNLLECSTGSHETQNTGFSNKH